MTTRNTLPRMLAKRIKRMSTTEIMVRIGIDTGIIVLAFCLGAWLF